MANYTISVINGEITVTDNGSPIGADLLDEGTDTVTGIEALGFVDGAIGVSLVTHTPTIEPVGDEFQVNNYTNFHQEFTAVAALADGGFVLTWSSDGQDQGGNTPAVVAQRFNADGTAAAPEFIVNSTLFNVQTSPDVTALGDGGFVITWQSNDQDGDDWGIYSQRYGPNGNTVGPETQVNAYTSGRQYGPQVASLANGGYAVTWSSEFQDGSEWGIYGQTFDANGNPVGSKFRANTHNRRPI